MEDNRKNKIHKISMYFPVNLSRNLLTAKTNLIKDPCHIGISNFNWVFLER